MIMLSVMNFYFLMFISIIMALSFNSSFMMWVSLEINMLSFLPIISSGVNIELENSVKYFLIQSWASIIFLMNIFFCSYFFNSASLFLMMAMFMKLGVAPFHTWFISVLKTCSFYILMLLSTVQKVIPLLILNNIFLNMSLFYFCMVMTIMFLLMMLPSVTNLNKLLALSSLGNILWLISSNILSLKLVSIFMFIYMYLLLGIFIFYNNFYYNTFMQVNSMNFLEKISIVLLFMSLGGMPPLLGFLSKFFILKMIVFYENMILFLLIIFSSLILLYHYMSRMYFFLTFMPLLKFNFNVKNISIIKGLYLVSILMFNMIMLFF